MILTLIALTGCATSPPTERTDTLAPVALVTICLFARCSVTIRRAPAAVPVSAPCVNELQAP